MRAKPSTSCSSPARSRCITRCSRTASKPNTSPKRRCGYAIRYMPATSLFDRSIGQTRIANNQVLDYSARPLWLLRGKDRAGNDFTAGH